MGLSLYARDKAVVDKTVPKKGKTVPSARKLMCIAHRLLGNSHTLSESITGSIEGCYSD